MAAEAVGRLLGLGSFQDRMPLALLLLSPCQLKGGNFGTIFRIRSHLERHGYTCHLWDPEEVEKSGDINVILNHYQIDLVIGIHAYHTGRFMKDSKVPYILILGGTDVNEFSKDEKRLMVMTSAVYRARYIVSFSESLQARALTLWPQLSADHLAVIRQAIRPVKNPLFLVDEVSDWHKENERILLVIVGHVADESYFQNNFQPALKRCTGVVHIPGLPTGCTHASMQQAFALVNSSQSEGMSLAILEAMQMRLPVIARNIPGNSSIIQDGHNGLLFSTPKEFREKATALLENPKHQQQLVSQAEEFVACYHNMEKEDAAYQKIITTCHFDPAHVANGCS